MNKMKNICCIWNKVAAYVPCVNVALHNFPTPLTFIFLSVTHASSPHIHAHTFTGSHSLCGTYATVCAK